MNSTGRPPGGGLRPGSVVAGYRLEERIGRGGMAQVFRAVDDRLGRLVALKILSPGLTADSAFRVRFINESRSAANVEHPHIIPVYEAGESAGMLFIAMRYVRGGDARSLLRRIGPLPAGRAWTIASQVAAALDAAHDRGLVHRDVKPGNMLLDASSGLAGSNAADYVYLTDFGISKQAQSAALTVTGQILGTLDYAAPEQIDGRGVDGRTDLYSLGCSVFELLTGTPPFRRSQGAALIYAQMSTPPPPTTASRPDLSVAVDRVIAKALAKSPDDRYPSCAEFATDLGRALHLVAGQVEAIGQGLMPPVASTRKLPRPPVQAEPASPGPAKPTGPRMPPGGLAGPRPPGSEPPTRRRTSLSDRLRPMADVDPRLRAVFDMSVPEVREYSGRHEYDGKLQDLSPNGVRAGLRELTALASAAPGPEESADDHDEAHLRVFVRAHQVAYGEVQMHRRNPYVHLANMDLACYDREYAPADKRARARRDHFAAWPDAVEMAISSLDRIPAPVASALSKAVHGLAGGIPTDSDEQTMAAALAAHSRLVDHVNRAAQDGPADAALGSEALTDLMNSSEGTDVDLGRLALRADAERDRLLARLAESCALIDHERPAMQIARELVRQHPDATGVIDAARVWTERVIDFTRRANLVPYQDGECQVALAPESRRWAMAMMSTAAPGEPPAPSMYYITPPDPSWPDNEVQEWLEVFSDTTLPSITAHEVAPGHFSHGRAILRAPTDIRRTLHSGAFVEGWAHYAEEVCVEEGFLADDPRFAIGVWLEALVRVTRLACAIGLHTASMSVADCAARFESDTHLLGPAALAEATRATFDPTYGRYTWGKLEIMALREEAKKAWGSDFSLLRFHTAMLDLGSPPLGLLGTAVARG